MRDTFIVLTYRIYLNTTWWRCIIHTPIHYITMVRQLQLIIIHANAAAAAHESYQKQVNMVFADGWLLLIPCNRHEYTFDTPFSFIKTICPELFALQQPIIPIEVVKACTTLVRTT